MRAFSQERGIAVSLPGPIADRIFGWFSRNTQEESYWLGPIFRGAHFFDVCFWPVDVPLFWGTEKVDAVKCLKQMPEKLKADLFSNPEATRDFLTTWGDLVDLALSIGDLSETQKGNLEGGLLLAGDRELRSTAELLLDQRPTAKAAHSAALALEIMAKWFLCVNLGLGDSDLRRYGHDLERLARDCSYHLPTGVSLPIDDIAYFPGISARYKADEPTPAGLWRCYRTALSVGATLLRTRTGRDVLREWGREGH